MVSLPALAGFATLCLVLVVIPGPSVMFILSQAMAHGRRAALLSVLGNSSGAYLQILLVSIGLGSILEQSVLLFTACKVLGAVYLVWLGIKMLYRQELSPEPQEKDDIGRIQMVTQGFLVGVTNPKSMVFFAAFLPQFIDRAGWPVSVQMAVLGLIFSTIAITVDLSYGLLGSSFASWLRTSQTRQRWMQRVAGVTMLGLGVRLITTNRAS